tara:strand:- start:1170 stop:1391 length:222 start_codon:yes stop_codon:yes gene_type:complete
MKFYLVSTIQGHFQLFTNKKDANAYKKEHDELQKDYMREEYEVTQVIIKKKQDVINFVNRLGGQPGEQWDGFF